MGEQTSFEDTVLAEADRSVESISEMGDDELLYLLSNYEHADEQFPEGWSGLATRASVTFELRRRDYDFERTDDTLILTGPDGEHVEP